MTLFPYDFHCSVVVPLEILSNFQHLSILVLHVQYLAAQRRNTWLRRFVHQSFFWFPCLEFKHNSAKRFSTVLLVTCVKAKMKEWAWPTFLQCTIPLSPTPHLPPPPPPHTVFLPCCSCGNQTTLGRHGCWSKSTWRPTFGKTTAVSANDQYIMVYIVYVKNSAAFSGKVYRENNI